MAIAVIDIGKTNAKVALVDLASLGEIAVRRIPNIVVGTGPYPHFDTDALWAFIVESLRSLGSEHHIDAISVTTHGATAALLDASGDLSLPILDYEYSGIDETRPTYDLVRPDFAETGSPALPVGLNLGTQLFFQQQKFTADFARVASILMYPQYWGFRLTGVRASEVTSLGCHTDLWSPHRRGFAPTVERLGWQDLFPPVRKANDELGTLLPAVAAATGLGNDTPVLTGIHDSNASLLPHLLARQPPFSVLSTGTWVIALAVGARPIALDPGRDTLINVNAIGDPVPSARFMGGRENALIGAGLPDLPTADDIARVLKDRLFYLPSAQPGSGPFPDAKGAWSADGSPGQQRAALSFYLALMAATCLELIGAGGPTIIEGPFAANAEFAAMLRAATGRDIITESGGTGTSAGAALLAARGALTPAAPDHVLVPPPPEWADYARAWRDTVARR